LAAYASGLPAFVLVKILAPGFFAQGDTATPVRVGVFVLLLNFGLNLALMGPLAHLGPPVATSVAAWLNVVLLSIMLRRRDYFRPDRMLYSRLARMLAATLLMAVAVLATRTVLVPLPGRHVSILSLSALVAAGLLTYGGLAQAFRVFDTAGMVRRAVARFAPAR
jgi:putative peptidoglycan lipid II flippase